MKRGETMSVAFICSKCGKDFIEPFNFVGSIKDASAYLEKRNKEITAQCCGVEEEDVTTSQSERQG